MSVFWWIYNQLRRSFSWWRKALQFLLDAIREPVIWATGFLTWILDFIWDKVDGVLTRAFQWVGNLALPGFAESVPLASYILVDLLRLDLALELLGGFIVTFVAARTARLAMVPLRALLEVL